MHIYMLSLVFYDCILINLPREETVMQMQQIKLRFSNIFSKTI